MPQEIERKFLLKDETWRSETQSSHLIVQGYFETAPGLTLRVRTMGQQAFLTLKGKSVGITRSEFEYEIPHADALLMLKEFCGARIVKKNRHKVIHKDHTWEIDEFDGENAGLIVAEIELKHENETFEKPPWVGSDVSHDKRYTNAALSKKPYQKWNTES
jgi:adenylate cyclase